MSIILLFKQCPFQTFSTLPKCPIFPSLLLSFSNDSPYGSLKKKKICQRGPFSLMTWKRLKSVTSWVSFCSGQSNVLLFSSVFLPLVFSTSTSLKEIHTKITPSLSYVLYSYSNEPFSLLFIRDSLVETSKQINQQFDKYSYWNFHFCPFSLIS